MQYPDGNFGHEGDVSRRHGRGGGEAGEFGRILKFRRRVRAPQPRGDALRLPAADHPLFGHRRDGRGRLCDHRHHPRRQGVGIPLRLFVRARGEHHAHLARAGRSRRARRGAAAHVCCHHAGAGKAVAHAQPLALSLRQTRAHRALGIYRRAQGRAGHRGRQGALFGRLRRLWRRLRLWLLRRGRRLRGAALVGVRLLRRLRRLRQFRAEAGGARFRRRRGRLPHLRQRQQAAKERRKERLFRQKGARALRQRGHSPRSFWDGERGNYLKGGRRSFALPRGRAGASSPLR